jgi:hypothetical protein
MTSRYAVLLRGTSNDATPDALAPASIGTGKLLIRDPGESPQVSSAAEHLLGFGTLDNLIGVGHNTPDAESWSDTGSTHKTI